jgi:acyl-CoA dehydrogenase
MLQIREELSLPTVETSGFEPVLLDQERAVQEKVHRFAREVMRPVGQSLDAMSARDAAAASSPFWEFHSEAAGLGIEPEALADLPPHIAVRVQTLIAEELGWGDLGLAVSMGAGGVPLMMAQATGDAELIAMTAGKLGCWVVTHPDRGSDATALYADERHPGSQGNIGNLTARVGEDEIVIDGTTSEWVSNGAVAQLGAMYIPADYGDGFFDSDGELNGVGVIVPFDLPGVSQSEPLTKLGQRALPQGAIRFDNVKVPRRFALCDRESYKANFASSWSFAGTFMCQTSTGLARAAFELALAYAHERRQGGAALAEHQLVQYRLGRMARNVELIRAVSRRASEFSQMAPRPHPYVTAQAKVTCTEQTFEVAGEALQMFGAAGLTPRHPVEKLFRDARASLIEDGENHVLTMRFGGLLSRLYQDGWTRS